MLLCTCSARRLECRWTIWLCGPHFSDIDSSFGLHEYALLLELLGLFVEVSLERYTSGAVKWSLCFGIIESSFSGWLIVGCEEKTHASVVSKVECFKLLINMCSLDFRHLLYVSLAPAFYVLFHDGGLQSTNNLTLTKKTSTNFCLQLPTVNYRRAHSSKALSAESLVCHFKCSLSVFVMLHSRECSQKWSKNQIRARVEILASRQVTQWCAPTVCVYPLLLWWLVSFASSFRQCSMSRSETNSSSVYWGHWGLCSRFFEQLRTRSLQLYLWSAGDCT